MKTKDIKVVAPANSPHICYIPKDYDLKIALVKKHSGKSLYRLLCASAGHPLGTKEQIREFKDHLRTLGYKTIGEWAVVMLDTICESGDYKNIPKPTKKED